MHRLRDAASVEFAVDNVVELLAIRVRSWTRTVAMFGFKRSSKSSRKSAKTTPPPMIKSNENKILYNVPSVSQIAPLPQNKSHGTLPVLSLDGRDAPNPMQSETSEQDLAVMATSASEETTRQPVGA